GYDDAAHRMLRERVERARIAERAIHTAAQASVKVETLVRQRHGAREREREVLDTLAVTAAEAQAHGAGLAALEQPQDAVATARHAIDVADRAILEHRTAAARAVDRLRD